MEMKFFFKYFYLIHGTWIIINDWMIRNKKVIPEFSKPLTSTGATFMNEFALYRTRTHARVWDQDRDHELEVSRPESSTTTLVKVECSNSSADL